ncbi:MAG: hypothetical protein J5I94_27885 [Phaeodactylibacter sp.]|nr:hypothetical protein [Phaeodactylibacter sp.]
MRTEISRSTILILFSLLWFQTGFSQEGSSYELGLKALESEKYDEAIDHFYDDLFDREYSYTALGLAIAHNAVYEYQVALDFFEVALSYEPKFDEETTRKVVIKWCINVK